MSGAPEALSTADLLDAIRARLEAQVAPVTVLPRLGDVPDADRQHRCIRVETISAAPPPESDPQRAGYVMTERTVVLRWWHAVSSANADSTAAAFASSIVVALTGKTTWAHSYKMTYQGQPVALSREGGYYSGTIEVQSRRGLPLE